MSWINEQTSNYTVQPQDCNKFIVFNSASAVTCTIPNATSLSGGGTFEFGVTNIGSGTVTISPITSTIDGASSIALTTDSGVLIRTDGTNYFTVRGSSSASGTVTSVAVAVPTRQSVSGSPITSSGTITISDNVESANLVFSGPSSGTPATPSFRALVSADLPVATTAQLGAVKPDGTTITISSGVISSSGGSSVSPRLMQYAMSTTDSVAFAGPVKSGNVLILLFKSESTVTGGTVSDTLGTVYTLAASLTGNPNNLAVYVGTATASGANTITVSGMGGSFDDCICIEAYGITKTVDTSATLYNGTGVSALTVTTTQADFIVFAFGGYHSADYFTSYGSIPFVNYINNNDALGFAAGYVPYSGSVGATAHVLGAGTDNNPNVMVAFKT